MDTELSHDDLHTILKQTVAELLADADVQSPPIDALQIAQHRLNIPVVSDRPKTRRVRDRIELSAADDEAVHQWTAALAIGDRLKPKVFRALGLEKSCSLGISPTKCLAQQLLTPSHWFNDDARRLEFDLIRLKQIYRTAPYEVIAWRFLDMPDSCIVTIIDDNRVSKRKSNAFAVRRTLESVENECQQIVHENGVPHAMQNNSWTVHGWPIHHLDVKREILRSVVEEDFADNRCLNE